MTDVKGLTKIGVHHKLFPQVDTFAYVNEYGMLINVVETLCGFDAYMDIENKYDNRFGKFTNKLDTYTFVSEDSNGVCTYDVLKVYPRDDYSRKYQAKLQLIQK